MHVCKGRMDPTNIASMSDKVDFKCGPAVPQAVRDAVIGNIWRVLRQFPEIVRLEAVVSEPEATDHGVIFLAKGTAVLGGPDLHTSVVGGAVMTAVDFLLENFSRQLRRRRRFKSSAKSPGAILPSLPAA